jgi:type II secretory ATPase GspE/PulE/Tfp pilus assembly ATPase PilB-like protein
VALAEDIENFLTLFYQDDKELGSIEDILGQLEAEEEEIVEAEKGVSEEDSAIVQMVNKMILDAYERDASDIHVEPYPGKKHTEVRFRVEISKSTVERILNSELPRYRQQAAWKTWCCVYYRQVSLYRSVRWDFHR